MLKRCAAKCTHFTMATHTATRTKALYTHAHTHNMYKTYTMAAGSTVQFISTNSPCLMKVNNKLKSKDN